MSHMFCCVKKWGLFDPITVSADGEELTENSHLVIILTYRFASKNGKRKIKSKARQKRKRTKEREEKCLEEISQIPLRSSTFR